MPKWLVCILSDGPYGVIVHNSDHTYGIVSQSNVWQISQKSLLARSCSYYAYNCYEIIMTLLKCDGLTKVCQSTKLKSPPDKPCIRNNSKLYPSEWADQS